MVEVPGGRIELHDARSQRRWLEVVRPFAMSRHPLFVGYERLPIVDISWLEAAARCNALSDHYGLSRCYEIRGEDVGWDRDATGYRLPTEAEWEHACRAGTGGPHYGPLEEIAWFEDNSGGTRHGVGEKAPNAFGLHDMLGNVWEWCWDPLDAARYLSYRTFRGGGWSDPAWSCRASTRRGSHPTFRIDDLGVRVARSL